MTSVKYDNLPKNTKDRKNNQIYFDEKKDRYVKWTGKDLYPLCKCKKSYPTFNYQDKDKPEYCAKCKKKDMINIKDNKCINCKKLIASFNYPAKHKPEYCGNCKTDDMVNVKQKKCIKCKTKRAIFNYLDQSKPEYCTDCKTDGMLNYHKQKKCIKCKKTCPTFNYKDKEKPEYCGDCKEKDMIRIYDNKCKKCKKTRANWNYKGEIKGILCSNCKEKDMIDVCVPRCIKCKKTIPTFNYKDKEKAEYCVNCKTDDMISVKNKNLTCKGPYGCQSRGNPKYDNYCVHCFKNLFPNDPRCKTIRLKSKEMIVRDFINENFKGFIHDKPIYTGNCDCTMRRRIDHRKLIGNTIIAVETDENQHKSYDDINEEIRYHDLQMVHGGKWIYIRYNPDKYKSKKGKCKDPPSETRLETLKNEIEKQINRIKNDENTELLEKIYLYYDGYD